MLKHVTLAALVAVVLFASGCTHRSANMGTAPTGGEMSPPAAQDDPKGQ